MKWIMSYWILKMAKLIPTFEKMFREGKIPIRGGAVD